MTRLVKLIPELKKVRPATDQQALPVILEKTGLRVDDFTRDMVDLIAHEEGTGGTELEIGTHGQSAD